MLVFLPAFSLPVTLLMSAASSQVGLMNPVTLALLNYTLKLCTVCYEIDRGRFHICICFSD